MKKNYLNIILCFFVLFGLCGCGNGNSNESPKETTKPTNKPEVQKYDNKDYDGSYYFDISSDNGSYSFVAKGYLVINNGECNTENQFNSSQASAYKRTYDGTCKYENDKLNINFKNGDYEKSYTCNVDNKDLKCELTSSYGISGNTEDSVVFKYKYNLEEWEYYKQYFSLYIPEDLRWNISSVELIEKYGTEKIDSAPNFSKELSWTHPLYTSTYKSYYVDEYTYLLSNDKLVAYFIGFEDDYSNPYSLYKDVKDVLVKKYGNPSSEKFNWIDNTYKDDETKWNDAMRYNHLDIMTVWNFDGYKLILKWKYKDAMNVEYVLNGNEGKI